MTNQGDPPGLRTLFEEQADGVRLGDGLTGIGGDRSDVEPYFRRVEEAGRTACRWCSPRFDDRAIWLAREPKLPIRELWPELRHYD